MALTRDFKQTIQARARRDPAFRKELLREGVESFITGDVETGKTVLRDYIHATVGFNELAGSTQSLIQEPDANAWPVRQSSGAQSV